MEFSRRERAASHLQKAYDLAREAVGWNEMFGAPACDVRIGSRLRRPHLHGITRGTTGVRSVPREKGITPDRTASARNHAGITSLDLNHAQHPIMLGTTGNPHDGPAYHTSTTGTGTTESARRAFPNRACLVKIKNGLSATLPQPPNALPFSCRERCTDCQNTNDLVREAVGCNGGLGGCFD